MFHCRHLIFPAVLALAWAGQSQETCVVAQPRISFAIHHVAGHPELSLNPNSVVWRHADAQQMSRDCTRKVDYPETRSEIRSFWTDTDLYFLFRCPFSALNLFLPPDNGVERVGLWDRDVVEMFLGDDWTNIRHYREFEVAPTGDWIDLAIDLDHKSYDHTWRSGWKTMAQIDKGNKIWYAAARIPLSSISTNRVANGTKWRMNLYRIDGLGPDPQRHFICWQPTCVQNRDPNHVPENFGTLTFLK